MNAGASNDERIIILHALSDHRAVAYERILAANDHTVNDALSHRRANRFKDADRDDVPALGGIGNRDDDLGRKRINNHDDVLAQEWAANTNRVGEDEAGRDSARHGRRAIVPIGRMLLFRENCGKI